MVIRARVPNGIVAIQIQCGTSRCHVVIYLVNMVDGFFRKVFEVRVIRLEITNHNIQRADILGLGKNNRTTKQSTEGYPSIKFHKIPISTY